LRFAELERSNAENRGWHRPIIDKIVEVCRQRAGHLIDAR
jgi:hypothetical protein